jgi:hypothetical protein
MAPQLDATQHILIKNLLKEGFETKLNTVGCKTSFTFTAGTKFLLRHIEQGCLAISRYLISKLEADSTGLVLR